MAKLLEKNWLARKSFEVSMDEDPIGNVWQKGKAPNIRARGGNLAIVGSVDPFLHCSQNAKQLKISFLGDTKAKAIKLSPLISKFFHYNHIPLNVVNSLYYGVMICNALSSVAFWNSQH